MTTLQSLTAHAGVATVGMSGPGSAGGRLQLPGTPPPLRQPVQHSAHLIATVTANQDEAGALVTDWAQVN